MTSTIKGDEAEIRLLVDQWAAAVRAYDVPGIVKDHSQEILMFDLPGPTQGRGLDAYRESWPQLFEWFHGARVFDVSELEITAGSDVAFATGLIRCQGTEKTGEVVTLAVRLTMGLRKTRGQWTVMHEHHSIPNE
jgi:ketosteroid isomerase-like protein